MNLLETTLVVATHSGKPPHSMGQVFWPALTARIKGELTLRSHGRRRPGIRYLGLYLASSDQLCAYATVCEIRLEPSAVALRGAVLRDPAVRPWI